MTLVGFLGRGAVLRNSRRKEGLDRRPLAYPIHSVVTGSIGQTLRHTTNRRV